MKSRVTLTLALCLLTAAPCGAQMSPATKQTSAPVPATHSAWRDPLIGAGIGAGIGMALGTVVDRNATCIGAGGKIVTGHCKDHYGLKLFGGDGAGLGALIGFLVHRHHS